MASILLWLGRGLYLGGGAIIGIMFEKISGFVAGLLPSTVDISDKKGGLAWWFVSGVAILSGIALYIITKMVVGKKKIFTLLALMACGLALDSITGMAQGVVAASLLFSIAASSTETKTIPYLPEFLIFNIATVPTNFKITVVGDGVVFALDGTGLTNLNGIRSKGALIANQYIYQVTNGYIGKNTTFTITNAQAAQLDVYGFSRRRGNRYLTYNMATAMANASLTIDRFSYAAFPSAAATDIFTVTWADGTSDDLTRVELQTYLVYNQDLTTTKYNLDNFNREVKRIQFRGAAEQSLYYLREQGTGGVVNQAL